jgi:uncharacterized protein involved in type VI secretion and phage assembly
MQGIYDSLNSMNDRMLALVNGVYVGIVTDNKDPQNLGRLKVKIPVIDNETSTDWARLAVPMAGKDRGTLFIPEVGDEVLVAFQMGDIRQPIIIGSLWNDKQKPPQGKDDKNNIRKIRSRSGHEIIFDDSEGKEKLTLQTKKGHKLEIADQNDTIKLTDKNAQTSITITGGSGGAIEIKSGSNKITLNNKGDVVIESMKSVKIKSTQLTIEATATLDVKASAALNLKTDGVLTLKGSIVKIN